MKRPSKPKPPPKCSKCGADKFGTPSGWVCPNNVECGERITLFTLDHPRPDELYNTAPLPEDLTTCPDCDGSGAVDCYECDGDGEIMCGECGHDHDCDECNGYGFVKCETCEGEGAVDKAARHFVKAKKAGAIK